LRVASSAEVLDSVAYPGMISPPAAEYSIVTEDEPSLNCSSDLAAWAALTPVGVKGNAAWTVGPSTASVKVARDDFMMILMKVGDCERQQQVG
jgi:hypothetical protein